MTSGFRLEADETCALLGYYTASSGNLLPTFQFSLSVPIFKGQGECDPSRWDWLSQNVGKKLQLLAE